MRPGRLDRLLYVGPPDADARKEIFRIGFRKMKVDQGVDMDILANLVRIFFQRFLRQC
jgi:AAA family ATPase